MTTGRVTKIPIAPAKASLQGTCSQRIRNYKCRSAVNPWISKWRYILHAYYNKKFEL